jgi:hypothetical protein
MARYDRIARLEPPPRSAAFPGWLALRDLEGNERDPVLSHRARLRFLSLRPARRLLDHGVDGAVDPVSLDQQVALARAELDRLPEGDPERDALSDYLEQVCARDPETIVNACMAVGAVCQAAGHGFAAEEFYQTALEMATQHAPGMDARESALRELTTAVSGAGDGPVFHVTADAPRAREPERVASG